MPDIRVVDILIPSPIATTFTWLQTPDGMLDETQALADAATIALASDARASPDDDLPDPRSDDLRGWWGDLDAAKIWGGWPLGSTIWLYSRSSITDSAARLGATVSQIENALHIAYQPFIDNRICSQVTIEVERQGTERIAARVVLYRGPKSAIALQFESLWSDIIP